MSMGLLLSSAIDKLLIEVCVSWVDNAERKDYMSVFLLNKTFFFFLITIHVQFIIFYQSLLLLLLLE